jgi:XTP/dITP diphosphohydrolase
MKIYFITGNRGKFLEVQEKLKNINIEIIQKSIKYPEVQTDTLEDVARFGAKFIRERFPYPFIIEDAGLFIDALKGFPGVYSKYVFFTIGCEGILKLMEDKTNRRAVFKSIYAFSIPQEEETRLFSGESVGVIAREERGEGGFGYDPIFIPNGTKETFAEMGVEKKNRYSHRGRALDKFIHFLEEFL